MSASWSAARAEAAHSVLLGWQLATLRTQLAAEAEQLSVVIRHRRATVSGPTRAREPLDRAHAALSMYLRRAAFEELQAAIRRIDDQRYGICAECGRTITFDHLRLRPQTVRCAECSRPTSTEP